MKTRIRRVNKRSDTIKGDNSELSSLKKAGVK
jgi:hypothetical protein